MSCQVMDLFDLEARHVGKSLSLCWCLANEKIDQQKVGLKAPVYSLQMQTYRFFEKMLDMTSGQAH